ncbi:MAG: glutathione S-transferase family protein [Deltaproteobacteria bacterium]|nr:MAG: glutathione S-transferase family protein [Deltaproteobacteria bacterium]
MKLVSFTICPYVQRAVLALEERGADYEVEFIDLRDKPDWFLELSPRGKVPILVLDDGEVLFESQVIVEYLDETLPGNRLTPADPALRARDRAWFTYASDEVFGPVGTLEFSDSAKHPEALRKLESRLDRLEQELEGRAYLSGDGEAFGLADVGFAPALYRLAYFETLGLEIVGDRPHVRGWMARVLARPSVQRSVPESWEADVQAGLARRASPLAA